MRRFLLDDHLLICPTCLKAGAAEQPLALGPGAVTTDDGDVQSGELACPASHTFLIREGLVALVPGGEEGAPFYESPAALEQYLAFHYPPPTADPLEPFLGPATPPFEERLPVKAAQVLGMSGEGPALDVGAGVGATTLALARHCGTAVGIDRSHAFVRAARQVVERGRACYAQPTEGELRAQRDVPVAVSGRVDFLVADATYLPFRRGAFGGVVGLNLICRVPDPQGVIGELVRACRAGGRVLVGGPLTWLEEYTPKSRWLGGRLDEEGVPLHGVEAVGQLLRHHLDVDVRTALPFFIPHHARSGQLGRSELWVGSRR